MPSIPKAYDPKDVEDKIYKIWEESGYFNPDNLDLPAKAEKFSIAMPPPNVTGILHLGHALENTLMDTMIRYQRMRGKKALLVPGTDHAAVATQAKVESDLVKSGKYKNPRQELGREKLLEIIRDYAERSKATILSQIRKMGTSCDWSRLAYTFDNTRSRAVNEIFVRMYNDGLIYRGYRAVNWSTKGQSTCSDEELVYVERPAKLYTFRYSKDFPISIATTRPETKLGDTAVAVNPKDERYKNYIGKTFSMDIGAAKPLEIKIIADESVDSSFGTGALGVTPAHSMIDFEMAEKNKLPIIKIIGEDGKMTAEAGKEYAGLTVLEAREKFVEYLKRAGLLEKEEDITQNVGMSDRFGDIVEVLPMTQWFVNVNKKISGKKKSLKDLMREAVTIGHKGKAEQKVKITPDRFEKVYLSWIDNLRDWCVSRQIWWGHRIPVWYRRNLGSKMQAIHFIKKDFYLKIGIKSDADLSVKTQEWNNSDYAWTNPEVIQIGAELIRELKDRLLIDDDWIEINRKDSPIQESEIYCGVEAPKGEGWIQDPDTLDTWFSSGTWTFSILGWPQETEDLKEFHPISWIQMGSDIIFFWMARMILMSTYIIDQIPFKDVYFHGLLRDKNGKKFSKSLGNNINPLEIIKKYGTDALRLSVIIGTTPGNDARFYEEKVEGYRNFVNKLWNIFRYIWVFFLDSNFYENIQTKKNKNWTLSDKWILSRMSFLRVEVTRCLDNYDFSKAGELLYDFTRNDFADWYVEISKIEKHKEKNAVFTSVMNDLLKMLHPFIPFVTEKIWSIIYAGKNKLLMVEKWPLSDVAGSWYDKKAEKDFDLVKNIIVAIRNLRAENKIEPALKVKAIFIAGNRRMKDLVESQEEVIKGLARLSEFAIETKKGKVEKAVSALAEGIEIYLPLEGLVDVKKELERIDREIKENEKNILELDKRLSNENFLVKAKKEIVEDTKEKLKASKENLKKLLERKKLMQ